MKPCGKQRRRHWKFPDARRAYRLHEARKLRRRDFGSRNHVGAMARIGHVSDSANRAPARIFGEKEYGAISKQITATIAKT